MTILITSHGEYLAESTDAPVVGRRYSLEDAATGTDAQNRYFHKLIEIYWRSGAWSYPGSGYRPGLTLSEFREYIKRDLGAGFEWFVYASPEGIVKVKTREEIPDEYNNATHAMGRLKSWAAYSKAQRMRTIDNVISEMRQVGVEVPEIEEI